MIFEETVASSTIQVSNFKINDKYEIEFFFKISIDFLMNSVIAYEMAKKMNDQCRFSRFCSFDLCVMMTSYISGSSDFSSFRTRAS
jgi:hypothetical protein